MPVNWKTLVMDAEKLEMLIEKAVAAERERCAAEIKQLQDALKGMLMEWDKLTRYGSPMAKSANERVNAARAAIRKGE